MSNYNYTGQRKTCPSLLIICVFTLVLTTIFTACQPASPTPTASPAERNIPTLAAPEWTDSGTAITVDNIANIQLLGRLDQPDRLTTIFNATISPDGLNLAALNLDEVLAWDLLTGELILHTGRGDAAQIFYSSDKMNLFVVDGDGRVRVLSAETGAQVFEFLGNANYNNILAFSENYDRMALGGSDGTIRVWDIFEQRAIYSLSLGDEPITALAWSPDETLLAGSDFAGKVAIWDEQTLLHSLTLEAAANETAHASRLRFDPVNPRIAIGTNSDIRLWAFETDLPPYRMLLGRGGISTYLEYSANGHWLISANTNNSLALWNGRNGGLVSLFPEVSLDRNALAFSPDGSLLITAAIDDAVRVWNISSATGQSIAQSELPVGSDSIFNVLWTEDGRLVLLFDANGAIYVWGISEN